MTEGPCVGVDCPECARYRVEGWTCPIGTLSGKEVSIYLDLYHRGTKTPNGFWKTDKDQRGLKILRFAIVHVAGVKDRNTLLNRFCSNFVLYDLRMHGWMKTGSATIFDRISSAFPEYGIYPWELLHAPKNFWKQPQAGPAALRWFLDRQGWTPQECYNHLISEADTVYDKLAAVGLSTLTTNLWIFDLLKYLDPSIDARSVRSLRQEQKERDATVPSLECPYCHGKYRGLIEHVLAMHGDESPVPDMPYRTPEVTEKRRKSMREAWRRRRISYTIKSKGIVIAKEYWGSARWAILEMESWSETLEIRPLVTGSHGWKVRGKVRPFSNGLFFIHLPRHVVDAIASSTTIRGIGHQGIALRFQSEESRQVVWEWFQQRADHKLPKMSALWHNPQWRDRTMRRRRATPVIATPESYARRSASQKARYARDSRTQQGDLHRRVWLNLDEYP